MGRRRLQPFDGLGKRELLEHQRQFIYDPRRYVALVGGVGGGKTWALCMQALVLGTQPFLSSGQRNQILVLRKFYPELRDTTMQVWYEEVCPPDWIAQRNDAENFCVLKNGTRYIFRSFEGANEISKLTSYNLGAFLVDQAEEMDEDTFNMLCTRLRRRDIPLRTGRLVANTNGHDWLYRRFKLPYITGKLVPDYGLFECTTRDNKYLTQDYLDDLEKLPELWRKRYVYGSWDAFAGQIYGEFRREVHVEPARSIPSNWVRFRSLDHGVVNPTCCLFWAVDEAGSYHLVDEYYQGGGIVRDHAAAIKQCSVVDGAVQNWLTYADPSMFARSLQSDSISEAWSIADEYAKHGLYLIRSNNDVQVGIDSVRECLSASPPRLYISERCTNLLEEITTYQWKDIRPNMVGGRERPRKVNDHAMDALRYGIMSMSPAAKKILAYDPVMVGAGDGKTWPPPFTEKLELAIRSSYAGAERTSF